MKRFLRVVLCIFLMTGILSFTKNLKAAGSYPNKPITFIVPIEAGSDGDILTRPLCQKASTILGQPIVVINKPGEGVPSALWSCTMLSQMVIRLA